jgi:hypothetical protein
VDCQRGCETAVWRTNTIDVLLIIIHIEHTSVNTVGNISLGLRKDTNSINSWH